jgi:hypothetical protein
MACQGVKTQGMWGLNVLTIGGDEAKNTPEYLLSQCLRIFLDNPELTIQISQPRTNPELYMRDVYNTFQII